MRNYSKLVLFTLLLFTSTFILAQYNSTPLEIREVEFHNAKHRQQQKTALRTAEYDVSYYRLELSLNPSVRFVSGNVTSYFTPKDSIMNSIVFDFGNMLIADSIRYHGQTYTNHNTSGFHTIEIPFPSPLPVNVLDSVSIYYRGTPRGAFAAPPFAITGNILWTLSEPYGAQEWWPCKNDLTDKADSIEIVVTTPTGNRVASNGLLLSIDTIATDVKYHWKTTYPTVSYLVAVGVGNYDFYEEKQAINSDSLLIHHFLLPTQTFSQSSSDIMPMMVFFDSLFGAYPFIEEKYGHASFGFGGGMEHQTISFMGSYGGELKAHELAHQWFGNKITCGSWSDLWLNEGFATYLTGLTYDFGVVHSNAFWQAWLAGTERASLLFPNGSVYRYGDTLSNTLFDNRVYAKGAMTLHTLRWAIGDSAFFSGVKSYISDTSLAYGFAKTPDLKRHLETSSGQNLTEFFDDWVYGPGFPIISTYWSQTSTQLNLSVQQTPSDASVPFFNIPIPYRLKGPAIDTIIVVDPSINNQQFNLPITQQVDTVFFDPENKILALEALTTSLKDLSYLEDQVLIYPNPVKTQIYLNIPNTVSVQHISIRNILGETIARPSILSNSIDVSTLSNGLYFIDFSTNQGNLIKKFQKID